MNRVFTLASFIPKTCIRRLSVTQAKCKNSTLTRIKKKQIHFQTNHDVPIYLRGGFGDYALYYSTIILMAVGMGISGSSLYKLLNKS